MNSNGIKPDRIAKLLKMGVESVEETATGCLGHRIGNPSDGYDFECEYEFSGYISCEDCIFGPYARFGAEGLIDPRINPEEEEEN